VPSDLARRRYHRSRIAQRIQPSLLLRTLPTLAFSTAASASTPRRRGLPNNPFLGSLRSEQPYSLRSFGCFALLAIHNINTGRATAVQQGQVRTLVDSLSDLKTGTKVSAEQSIHQSSIISPPSGNLPGIPFFGLQTPSRQGKDAQSYFPHADSPNER